MVTKKWSGVVQGSTKVGPFPPNDVTYDRSLTWIESSVGVQNPKWRSQVREHQNATTAYVATGKTFVSSKAGQMSYRYVNTFIPPWEFVGQYSGDILSPSMPSLLDPGNVRFLAYQDFVRNANKVLRSWNGMQAIGELSEAIHAIRHPLESMRRLMSEYISDVGSNSARAMRLNKRLARQRRPPRFGQIDVDLSDRGVLHMPKRYRIPIPVGDSPGRAVAAAISGTYLEYANGWAPLARDVVDASKALANIVAAPGIHFQRVNGKASKRTQAVLIERSVGNITVYLPWDQYTTDVLEASCKHVGEVVVSQTGSFSDALREANFSLRGFVPTIWELLPLSYVADWFTNIGDLLEAVAFNRGSVVWDSSTVRQKTVRTIKGDLIQPTSPPLGFSNRGTLGSAEVTTTSVERSAPENTGVLPSIQFSLPASYLLSKALNVTSLLTQARTQSRYISHLFNG